MARLLLVGIAGGLGSGKFRSLQQARDVEALISLDWYWHTVPDYKDFDLHAQDGGG